MSDKKSRDGAGHEYDSGAENTIDLFHAWLHAAVMKKVVDAQADFKDPKIRKIYSWVRFGYEDIRNQYTRDKNLSLGCDETAARMARYFELHSMDPAALKAFHTVRKFFPNPLANAPAKNVIAHIDAAL